MRTRTGSHGEVELSATERDPVRTVFLVGFMGAGKSSVGRALSLRLGWGFEDLDDRIQAREGRSIGQIFRQSGEDAFRRAEADALRELIGELESSPRVVGLGGGAFVQAENAALLAQTQAPIVFLDAPVDELFRRCQQEQVERPLRQDRERFRQLYEARRPRYLVGTLRIETAGKSVDAVAVEVAGLLGIVEDTGTEGAAK
jgi:shikimate kinase